MPANTVFTQYGGMLYDAVQTKILIEKNKQEARKKNWTVEEQEVLWKYK